MNRFLFLVIVSTLGFGYTVYGQFSFTALSGSGSLVSENFTGFTGAGFDSSPGAGQLDSDAWIAGGFRIGSGSGAVDVTMSYGDSTPNSDFARGVSAGGESTGGIYGFDVSNGGTVDRALGVQPSTNNFVPGFFEVLITNGTGQVIEGIDIGYDIFNLNNAGRSSSFNLSYAIGVGGSLVDVTSANYTSLAAATPSANWVSNGRAVTINQAIAAGEVIRFRWTGDDVGGSGGRDEFALDNFTAQVIPEPSTYALIFGGLTLGVVLIWKRRTKAKEG